MGDGPSLAVPLSRLPLLGFAELVHQSWEIELGGMFGTLLSEHKLIYLLDHIEVFMEDLALIDDGAGYLATHVSGSLGHQSYLHLQHIDVILLMHQQIFEGI